ncbi:MAG: hypothetical protein ABI193_05815 [Minicystis sp.]
MTSKGPPEIARTGGDPASPRPLSTPAAIGISGLTAAIVMGLGVLVAERLGPPRRTEPLPPPPRATVVLPAESSAPVVAASAPTIVAASAPTVVAASVSAPAISASIAAPVAVAPPSASATAPPVAAAIPGDPALLPARRGVLVVGGPAGARVYIKGEDLGASNEALIVPCGLAFVRLGTPREGQRYPTWIGEGVSAVVACRAETRIEAGVPARP